MHRSLFGILHIYQSYLAIRESRLYSVLMPQYETRLAYLWQSCSFCWPMIEVQVHRIVLATYPYDRSIHAKLLSLAYDQSSSAPEISGHIIVTDLLQHIHQSDLAIQTDYVILSTCVRIWDTGSLICGKAAAFAGISLKFWHTSDGHPRESDAETRMGYSWLSCSFRCWVCPGLWLKFRNNWDLPIQSRMSFLDIYKTNCDKLRLIMDISFEPRHTSRATNMPPMCMYPSLLCTLYCGLLHSHYVFLRLWISGCNAHRSIKTLHL